MFCFINKYLVQHFFGQFYSLFWIDKEACSWCLSDFLTEQRYTKIYKIFIEEYNILLLTWFYFFFSAAAACFWHKVESEVVTLLGRVASGRPLHVSWWVFGAGGCFVWFQINNWARVFTVNKKNVIQRNDVTRIFPINCFVVKYGNLVHGLSFAGLNVLGFLVFNGKKPTRVFLRMPCDTTPKRGRCLLGSRCASNPQWKSRVVLEKHKNFFFLAFAPV